MAAPITHIVLSEKIFEKFFSGLDKKTFMIGTSFPDIRYLANIDRKVTHFEDVKMSDILKEDSFLAGFYFHSRIDRVMNEYFQKKNVFSFFSPGTENIAETVKTIFDKKLKTKMDNWNEVSGILDEVLEEELRFGVSKVVVTRWHEIVQEYISVMPDFENALPKYIVHYASVVTENVEKAIDGLSEENAEMLNDLAEEFYYNIEGLILD